jgi:multicomponent Na+:H+ antiporter subunit E
MKQNCHDLREVGLAFFVTAVFMFGYWVVLSGYFDAFHLISGAVSSLLVAWFSHDLFAGKSPNIPLEFRRVVRFLRYLPWLMWEIVKANIDLVYRTLHPSMPISPRMIRFQNTLKDEMGITTLANSITLTPGTVTVDANEEEYIVHAISEEAAEGLLAGDMARQVKFIETGSRDV